MRSRRHPRGHPTLIALVAILILPLAATAQTRVEPGFNLFTHEQDVEIGEQSAREVEQQFPVIDERDVSRYVDRLGARLAENAPGYDYPYQFEVLDVAEVNAFALPGGFMYLNRGLLVHADNEATLAAVMAHELAHVALRHGTNQASKAYLGDAGLSLITGLIGGETASDVVGAVGGFGLNTLFLSFSRDDEREADIVGAQILARSGYDPTAMAQMFESLQQVNAASGAGEIPTFLSSHPPYDERRELVRREAQAIGQVDARRPVGGFATVQAQLRAMPEARSMSYYLDRRAAADQRQDDPYEDGPYERQRDGELSNVRIEPASEDWVTVRQSDGYFSLSVPENWQVREAARGFGMSVVPPGGMVQLADGRNEIVYGVMIDHFAPHDVREDDRWWSSFTTDRDWEERRDDPGSWLEEASDQLVDVLQEANPHLRPMQGSERTMTVDADRAYAVTLEGHNPVTDRRERVTVLTRQTDADGHLVYALLIAPDDHWELLDEVFGRMMDSLRIDDSAVHASAERQ